MDASTETKPSRPLPTTERGRRTRAAIIEAAADLFYAQGVAATSLDEVIARSRTGKSQLYHYFADRRDLVRAVLDLQLERVLGSQPRLASISTWTDFEAWAEDLVDLHRGPSGPLACPVGSLAAEIDRDDSLRLCAAEAFRTWCALIEAAIGRLQLDGEISRQHDPSRHALRVLGALQGGMLLANTLDDVGVLADTVEHMLLEVRATPPT